MDFFSKDSLLFFITALVIGILIGVRITISLYTQIKYNKRKRYYQGSWDNPSDYPEPQSGSSFFNFLMLLFVAFLLFLIAKSAFQNYDFPGKDLINWTKKESDAKPSLPPVDRHQTDSFDPLVNDTDPDLIKHEAETLPSLAQLEVEKSTPNPNKKQYIVQFGSFKEEDRATDKVKSLKKKNIQANSKMKITETGKWYTIYSGPYDSEAEADKIKAKVSDESDALIMPFFSN